MGGGGGGGGGGCEGFVGGGEGDISISSELSSTTSGDLGSSTIELTALSSSSSSSSLLSSESDRGTGARGSRDTYSSYSGDLLLLAFPFPFVGPSSDCFSVFCFLLPEQILCRESHFRVLLVLSVVLCSRLLVQTPTCFYISSAVGTIASAADDDTLFLLQSVFFYSCYTPPNTI